MWDKIKNFAISTLNGAINNSVLTLVVQTGDNTKFPAVEFNCVIWKKSAYAEPQDDPNAEIVRITNKSGDTFTITRAQEGTSAHAHEDGDRIELNITGKVIQDIIDNKLSNTADSVKEDFMDWGTAARQVSQDDVVDGSTQKQYNPAAVAITGGTIDGITTLGCGAITTSDDIIIATDSKGIRTDTADGSDNQVMILCGGGGLSDTRGGNIWLYGNEHGAPGYLTLAAGNVAGSAISMRTAGSVRLTIGYDGSFDFNSNAVSGITTVACGTITTTGDIVKSGLLIRAATADGSDNSSINICGGGAVGVTRGANIFLTGNEEATYGGKLYLQAGNIGTGTIIFSTANVTRLEIGYTGVIDLAGTARVAGDPTTDGYFVIKLSGVSYKVPCLAV